MIDDWVFMFPRLFILLLIRFFALFIFCWRCSVVYSCYCCLNMCFNQYIHRIMYFCCTSWRLFNTIIWKTLGYFEKEISFWQKSLEFEFWLYFSVAGETSEDLLTVLSDLLYDAQVTCCWSDMAVTLDWKGCYTLFAHSIGINKKHIKSGLNVYDAFLFILGCCCCVNSFGAVWKTKQMSSKSCKSHQRLIES